MIYGNNRVLRVILGSEVKKQCLDGTSASMCVPKVEKHTQQIIKQFLHTRSLHSPKSALVPQARLECVLVPALREEHVHVGVCKRSMSAVAFLAVCAPTMSVAR